MYHNKLNAIWLAHLVKCFYAYLKECWSILFILSIFIWDFDVKTELLPAIIYDGGWHRKEMFSLVNILLVQPLKVKPNLKYIN
jgi:hypothetical protein